MSAANELKLPALWWPMDAMMARDGQLKGRQAVGKTMLRGFVQHYKNNKQALQYICGKPDIDAVANEIRQMGWQAPLQARIHGASMWQHIDQMFISAPISSDFILQRSYQKKTHIPLSGVTHTVCSLGVVKQVADYFTVPTQPWDALICTSTSVVQVVEKVWDAKLDELRQRLGSGVQRPTLPQLPKIPLGLHSKDFAKDPARRQLLRQQLGVNDDTIILAFVGRLSVHAKANPLAMYRALAEAGKRTGKSVLMLECGWFPNDHVRNAFDEVANACGLTIKRVDGREQDMTAKVYAAADIFCSLSDNIQESFGLTPIEAMAAGLPVVVSDWDGYKDTVRDGVDGFRIPTLLPESAATDQLIEQYLSEQINYDHYIGRAHALCAVNIPATVHALVQLIESKELREKMGAAGQERARTVFDWQVIMSSYQTLWDDQRAQSQSLQKNAQSVVMAELINPFDLFAEFPTERLLLTSTVRLTKSAADTVQERGVGMWAFLPSEFILTGDAYQKVVAFLAEKNLLTIAEWAEVSAQKPEMMLRVASWLLKVGALEVVTTNSADAELG